MIRIAVLGYGTVGSGVVKVIQTNAKIIAKRAGQEVEVKYVLDLRDFPDDPIQSKVVHDFNVILEDPEVDIVVETMGGTRPAYEFVKKSLLAGKSVCTSNKELVAAYGAELVSWATAPIPPTILTSTKRNTRISTLRKNAPTQQKPSSACATTVLKLPPTAGDTATWVRSQWINSVKIPINGQMKSKR